MVPTEAVILQQHVMAMRECKFTAFASSLAVQAELDLLLVGLEHMPVLGHGTVPPRMGWNKSRIGPCWIQTVHASEQHAFKIQAATARGATCCSMMCRCITGIKSFIRPYPLPGSYVQGC